MSSLVMEGVQDEVETDEVTRRRMKSEGSIVDRVSRRLRT